MSAKPKSASAQALSFEDALKELETIVKSIETGDIPLEQAISAYTRGMELQAHCRRKLEEAKLQVEKITLDHQGQITLKDFDETE